MAEEYSVAIHFDGAAYLNVEASSEEEAAQLALKQFDETPLVDLDWEIIDWTVDGIS